MRPIDADALKKSLDDLYPFCGHCDGYGYLSTQKVEDTIDKAPTIEQPTWVSCEERLPAESGYYLVVYRDKFNGSKLVYIDFYTKCTAGEWWDNDFGRTAIYWMPLPYEGTGIYEGRCYGTKEIDPCPGYDKCSQFKPNFITK